MNTDKVMTFYGRRRHCLGEFVFNDEGEKIFTRKVRNSTFINRGLNAFGLDRPAFENRIKDEAKFIEIEDIRTSKIYLTRSKIWKENGIIFGSEIFLSLKYFMVFDFGKVTQKYPENIIQDLEKESVQQVSLFSFV